MSLNIGQRIRVREMGSTWPERVGCVGVIVEPPEDGTYPQPAKSECLVLLDFDPLGDEHSNPGWTCVLRWTDVEPESVAVTAQNQEAQG